MKLLSIDAWRNSEGGWEWNEWYTRGEIDISLEELTPRKLLALLRERGYLTAESRGRVAIEDDGYNLVVLAKGTREPLYAVEYGCY